MPVRSRVFGVVGRAAMDIRNGRFKGDASSGIPIIAAKAKVDAAYRIFNSGDENSDPALNPVFEVHADYTPAPVLQPGCSLDVLVKVTKQVAIQRGDTIEVVGSYEFLDRPNSFRSGRFKGDASGIGIPIVLGRGKKLYRIFNSGKTPFSVDAGTSVTSLEPTFSLDVVVGNGVFIKASGEVAGIYEYLGTDAPVRSGRFKIKAAPSSSHKIIDLSPSAPEAYYRIFNSGNNGFKVQAGGVDLTHTIGPEQSFDFAIGAKKDITVVATGVYPIEGIYDLLSTES